MDDLDTSILMNTAALLVKDPQGMEQLLASAGNTENPATGVAMYLMMMMEAVSEMLEKAGIDVAPDTWLAQDGVLDQLMPTIIEILANEGMQVGPSFGDEVTSAILERAKGIVQAEEQSAMGAAPQAAPAEAGLLGRV